MACSKHFCIEREPCTRTILGSILPLPPVPGLAGPDAAEASQGPSESRTPPPLAPKTAQKSLSLPNIVRAAPPRAAPPHQHHTTAARPRAPQPATTGFFGSSKPKPNPNMLFEETEAEPTGPDLRPDTEFMWYWEEDGHRVKNHHTWDKQGNFIAYPPKVSTPRAAVDHGPKCGQFTNHLQALPLAHGLLLQGLLPGHEPDQ